MIMSVLCWAFLICGGVKVYRSLQNNNLEAVSSWTLAILWCVIAWVGSL